MGAHDHFVPPLILTNGGILFKEQFCRCVCTWDNRYSPHYGDDVLRIPLYILKNVFVFAGCLQVLLLQ